jgi:NAD(P)-dependent dehydrogenase (short-subunit alcohol dehydrogenase family)
MKAKPILKPIKEQVVVVCGASSGIGRETALRFAKKGAKVVVSARSGEALMKVVKEIERFGREAVAVPCDVTDFEQVKDLAAEAVRKFGRIDTWVHTAGVTLYATFENTDPAEFARIVAVNLLGQVHGAKAALPHLKQTGGGALIHISSVEAHRAVPYQSAYAASKHGMIGFLDALRLELEHEGWPIAVTNIMPAGINTPFFDHGRTKLGVKPKPVAPVYQPATVADVILYAAEHPSRDLVAGGSAKMLIEFQKRVPRLLDKFLEKTAFEGQKTKEPRDRNALDNVDNALPVERYPGSQGEFGEHSKRFSLYNWLETHPKVRIALGFTAAAAVSLVTSRGRPLQAMRKMAGLASKLV